MTHPSKDDAGAPRLFRMPITGEMFPPFPLLPVARRFRLPSIDIRLHYSSPITAFV